MDASTDPAAIVDGIINEHFPPGSDKRARLDAAADSAVRLLAEQGYDLAALGLSEDGNEP